MPKRKRKHKRVPIHHHVKRAWSDWPYKHMTLVALIITAFVLLLDTAIMAAFFEFSRGLGYIGAFIAGMLSVSLFTAAAGVVILFELGQTLDPVAVIGLATIGSVLADFIILEFFEDNIMHELRHLSKKLGLKFKVPRRQKRRVRLFSGLIGIVMIGSPLPDELGLAVMDISHWSTSRILIICAVANCIGLTAIVLAGYLSLNS